MTHDDILDLINQINDKYRDSISLDEWIGLKTTTEQRAQLRLSAEQFMGETAFCSDVIRLVDDVETMLAAVGRLLDSQ